MISTRILLLLVLTSCAYGHKIVKEDQKQHDHNVGIIGGHTISIKQAPFMVSIRGFGFIHVCGGSIIHERFILTAASCVALFPFYKVSVGSDNLKEEGKLYDVEKIIIHEQYSNKSGDYDVALLKLKKSLTFGPRVSRVLLKGHGTFVKVKLGTMLNITGWGVKDPEYETSDLLQQTTVPVVSNKICEKYIKNYQLTSRMMCTNAIQKDPCMGDEGGPLTWNNIQIGIITYHTGCGAFPSVYTRVKTVNRWIKKTINKHDDEKEN